MKNKYPHAADPLQLLRLRPHNAPAGMGFFYAANGREARALIRSKQLLERFGPVDVIAITGRVLFTLRPPAGDARRRVLRNIRITTEIFLRHHAEGKICHCPRCQLHRRRQQQEADLS